MEDGCDELRLLEAAAAGDLEAFGDLYARYREPLIRRCKRITGDLATAEDVVQEAFVRAFLRLKFYDASRPFWPWLLTIGQRQAIDVVRHRNGNGHGISEADEAAASSRDGTFDAVWSMESGRKLRIDLEALPERQRRSLVRSALDGWSYREIAAEDGSSVATVKALIHRARATLRGLRDQQLVVGVGIGFRRVRAWLDRASARFGVGFTQSVSDGLFGRLCQTLPAGVIALGVGFSSLPAGMAPPQARAVAADPAFDAGGGIPSGRRHISQAPLGPRDGLRPLVAWGPEPEDGATPEQTEFYSMTVSPTYERDHTVYALGYIRSCNAGQLLFCPVLFVTHNGGTTWRPQGGFKRNVNQIIAPPDPRRTGIVFATGTLGLLRSVDEGRNFYPVSPLPTLTDEAAASPEFWRGDKRIVMASTTLLEYRDETMTTRPSMLPIEASGSVIFSPAFGTDGVILVASGSGPLRPPRMAVSRVYRCERSRCAAAILTRRSGGVSPKLRISPRFPVDGVAVAYAGGGLLYVSRDGARSFSPMELPAGLSGLIWDFTVLGSSEDPTILATAAGAFGGVFRSTDGGRSWIREIVGVPGFANGATYISAAPTGRVFVTGSDRGIACSDDNGISWSAVCTSDRAR